MLKALVVQETSQQAPYTHDLLVLYRKLEKIDLIKEAIDLLDEVNRFNIRARYPDYKLQFYKQYKLAYTTPYFKNIT